MFTSGWRRDMMTATTAGRCVFYVTPQTAKRRHGAICKRQGRYSLTVGNLMPTGPFCHQHGKQAEDRATAAAIGTDRSVRLEVIK